MIQEESDAGSISMNHGPSIVSGFDQGETKHSGVSQVKRSEMDKKRTHIESICHLCQINRDDDYLSIVLVGDLFEV